MNSTGSYIIEFSSVSARWFCIILLVGWAQAGSAISTSPVPDSRGSGGLGTVNYAAASSIVQNGGSIQAAVDAANPGDLILIKPGTYSEAVTIDKPNLKLIGLGLVIIKNPGDEENGITVTDDGDGVDIENLTVRDFEENGVLLENVDGFRIFRIITIDDGEYGIFPVSSVNGEIIQSEASGHNDSGIYVGLSEHVTVSGCRAFANVSGFEIENSTHILLTDNEAYDNTAGILAFLLPFLPKKTASDIVISKNIVHDNNRPNFADPDDLVSFVPDGLGILIIGTDDTIVTKNQATNNDFAGIGVGSTLLLGNLAGIDPGAILADIEPFPDSVEVRKNRALGNGANPPSPFPFPGADLLWDGSGSENCWGDNIFATSFPAQLPGCD